MQIQSNLCTSSPGCVRKFHARLYRGRHQFLSSRTRLSWSFRQQSDVVLRAYRIVCDSISRIGLMNAWLADRKLKCASCLQLRYLAFVSTGEKHVSIRNLSLRLAHSCRTHAPEEKRFTWTWTITQIQMSEFHQHWWERRNFLTTAAVPRQFRSEPEIQGCLAKSK